MPRSHHTATLLNDGTVLFAGGKGASGQLASLEIYHPTSQKFSMAASLKYPRQDHTAVLLSDGTVLIAGGAGPSGPLSSAELFNPLTNSVTETGSLNQSRTRATASQLYNFGGTVLIEGGQGADGIDLNTAEEFNPATGTFTILKAHMNTARSGHIGVTLPYNGKVLVAGGTSAGQPVTANELYDPIVNAFVANEPMSTARDAFAANFFAVPAVGQVLISGGLDISGTPLALSEIFAYPTIRTDKSDYPPGSPVTIYGAGWTPGETVAIQIQETDSDDTWLSDTADSNGSFTDTSFNILDTEVGVKFLMTATGATSRQTAQDKFMYTLYPQTVTAGTQLPNSIGPDGICTAPSVVNSGAANFAFADSLSMVAPASLTAGNLLCLAIVTNNDMTDFTAGTGWVNEVIGVASVSSLPPSQVVFCGLVSDVGAGPWTFMATNPSTNYMISGGVVQITGENPSTILDAVGAPECQAMSSTTPFANSITTNNNDLVLWLYDNISNNAASPSTEFSSTDMYLNEESNSDTGGWGVFNNVSTGTQAATCYTPETPSPSWALK